ncbi:uncharacterized protein LY89DRAFT_719714 [Mollisia scopiformis]|uniref:Alpha/beta-hydrolase n=1 Tax=Mollisia scopiformis TaxID=149040 RepID=A0A194X7J3_MOLSC|nr:uncharacterized protein LY89DRAFT_719714 [Mollisia scopiformis]KUJ16069.1 hypothetical protein LY89DRAFT_719714 [Mollisia scopiformis]
MSSSPVPLIRKAYADTTHGQIHYRYAHPPQNVAPKPTPLLFLHKSASSSASHTSLMIIYASRGYICYAPDMPGFGGSFDQSPEAISLIQSKDWHYLKNMGVGEDINLWQREAVDHIRAWKGRNLVYGAVWDQDAEILYADVKCKVLLMCARDDVLWKYFDHVKDLRSDVRAVEVAGGNFELDRDVEGIEKYWIEFLEGSFE